MEQAKAPKLGGWQVARFKGCMMLPKLLQFLQQKFINYHEVININKWYLVCEQSVLETLLVLVCVKH